MARTGTEGKEVRLTGYTISMLILRALATEIVLKALSFKTTGTYEKTHDLLDLFDSLDCRIKVIVTAVERSQGVAPLRQILEKHRGDFVEWRYIGEAGERHTDFLDLDKALNVLMTVYLRKDFIQFASMRGR